MRKTLPLLVLMVLLMSSIWASNLPSFTFSAELKNNTPTVDMFRKTFSGEKDLQKKVYRSVGVAAEVDYRFVSAGFSFLAGKNTLGETGVYPSMLFGLILPINNSKIMIGRGYSFVEKQVFFRAGYTYNFKKGISVGLETNHPTKFSFSKKNWSELNHLKETLLKTQIMLKVGYTPDFFGEKSASASAKNDFRFPSKDWYFKTSQSVLFSTFGYYNKNDNFRLGLDISIPWLYGVARYLNNYRYRLQIMDVALFTTLKFDASLAYEFPIKDSGFIVAAKAGLSSVWFNGQYMDVPANYQAYSITSGASIEYWVNSKNGFFLESNVPTLTFYYNEGETSPRVRTLFNDDNVKTAVKYMTKVGYVHKLNSK